MEEKQHYLTTGEAADWLGVSKSTLNRLIRTGEIEAVVLPGMTHRRIAVSELRRYIKRGDCRG